jgi:hypothetical protein
MTIPQAARPQRLAAGAARPETATPDPARELRAWRTAVEHLHSRGLPAAVPEFVGAWLERRGAPADWTWAA